MRKMNKLAQQHEDVEDKLRLSAPTIYEIISREGREELNRPESSLIWSAIVAGICISFSVICEGLLLKHVPENGDYFLLENLGYTVGFLIVILGRFQLFTENTITVILPLLEHFRARTFTRTMKLWGIVLSFNFVGTFIVALLISFFPFFSAEQFDIFMNISDHAVNKPLGDIFVQAIPAGFLIAALVWMLPSSSSTKFWVIMLMTYIIAIGDFAHIVAGSTEAFLLMINGATSISHGLGYLLMVGLGNIIGGTGLFALMAYAQVKEEM